jgi:hypothetical protein
VIESIISRKESLGLVSDKGCLELKAGCIADCGGGGCELPEGLLVLEDILVALLALLGTVADGVGLLHTSQFRCSLV